MTRAHHAMPPASWRCVAAVAAIVLVSACSGGTTHTSGQPAIHPPTIHGPTWAVKDPAQAAAPPALPAKADGPTVEIPSSIDHSCNTDVTAALNDVFTSATDNSTIPFPQGACYRADATLTIDSYHRLDIEGNGATLKTGTVGDRNRRQFVVSASDDITVRDLVLVGSNERAGATKDAYDSNLAFQHAFSLTGA